MRPSTSSRRRKRRGFLPDAREILEQPRLHRLHRARAVRQFVLRPDARLGERHAELRREEQRVVAEAAGAARRVEDHAFTRAVRGDHVVAERPGDIGQREHRAKPAGALRGRHAGERLEQLLVVRGVVVAGAGVARAVDAGCAAERVDLEAAVVGERGQAGRLRHLARLLRRVAGERVGVLDDIGHVNIVERSHFDAGQQLAQLDELAAIARREHERSHAIALRCAAVSSWMPARARSSIASSCLRSKLACSAVPWTSISLPEASPTTFMSTSALLSSTYGRSSTPSPPTLPTETAATGGSSADISASVPWPTSFLIASAHATHAPVIEDTRVPPFLKGKGQGWLTAE